MIITKTPVRLSFFGGGTDYPAYFNRYPGAVLGTTINKYNYVTINPLSPFFDYNYRISYSKQELVKNYRDIIHPSVRECLTYFKVKQGTEINVIADLPARSGLGSSSTFTVGLINALYALKGITATKEQLALDAVKIEQKLIGELVGSQDQYHAAYGGLNKIEFYKNNVTINAIKIDEEYLRDFDSKLLLFFTGQTRYADEILDEQIKNTETRVKDKYLMEMCKMVNIGVDLLKNGEIESFGKLLHESWIYKKELSSKIANKKINNMYSAAMDAGAYGGKLAGAGGGGFLMFVVPDGKKISVRKALKNLLEVDFSFDRLGAKVIFNN